MSFVLISPAPSIHGFKLWFKAGGPIYEVETGRRDGTISDAALAFDFPEVNDPIDVLKSKFRNKGLSEQDLVLLGIPIIFPFPYHCQSFQVSTIV